MIGKKYPQLSKAKKGKKNPMWGRKKELSPRWKGDKAKHKHLGYWLVRKPNHPFARKNGYVMRSHLVMEKFLGRYLETWENVHHINGIKDDDRIENLKIVIHKKHFGQVKCPKCLYEFLIK